MAKIFYMPLTGQLSADFSPSTTKKVASALSKFSSVFINLPQQTQVHAHLDCLRLTGKASKGEPQRALRCLAPPASGKSTLAQTYARSVNTAVPAGENSTPVVYVSLQNNATSKRFMQSILFGRNASDVGTEMMLKRRIVDDFAKNGVELLIIDEIHHASTRDDSTPLTNVVKSFLNDAICPVAFFGTPAAENLFRGNRELAQRTQIVCDIKPLKSHAEDMETLAAFLVQMDRELVKRDIFRRSSSFLHDHAVECLMEVSEGVVGAVARILQHALEIAVWRHADHIEMFDLARAVDEWAIPQGYVNTNPFLRGRA
ncbi:hypothetical protein AEAC466_09600 [Asticcacaulis sp. AC466]|uniref:TniB family NTP-binding protein n=1 Tax=Asticcacaulis sp. AC466 TaxID=1282362 RepID=UPI0003C3DDB2|nr:TniB family NTP-binding protein [Asticcacaulis sp. AC466]ESQ83989.1 hypothetical protein AEAC466_09600 [Asticcacaulis sp. AC466]